MADKKRSTPKSKKPAAKKNTKPTQDLETKTVAHKEEEMEQHEELKNDPNAEMSNAPIDIDEEPAPGNEVPADEEDRQPYYNNPRNGEGVRPQDVRPSDEYTIETYFDKNQRLFIATVVEYPELRCTGHTRDEAQVDLEERLEDHVYDLRARGSQMAEPVQSKHYPEKLELPLSQSLFRKLDQMSRHEKLPIDRLIGELLSAALDRRGGQNRPAQSQQHHHQHNRDHRDRDHRDRDHHGGGHHNQNRHGNGNHRNHGGNRPQQRGNYRALDSRENFMEYVRNLEKGGGQGGWKKR